MDTMEAKPQLQTVWLFDAPALAVARDAYIERLVTEGLAAGDRALVGAVIDEFLHSREAGKLTFGTVAGAGLAGAGLAGAGLAGAGLAGAGPDPL